MPLLTVIVAVFNGKATLQQCIESFVMQTYTQKELIVIDGGSTDGTVDILKVYCNEFSYWVSEPDRGIYNAWNKGVEQARGEWICFLGADDYFLDLTVLERMVEKLKFLPSTIGVAYGQIMLISPDGQTPRLKGEPWIHQEKLFKQYMCIPHVGTMHRRSLFERHGKFDESFRIAGDYEFLLRELIKGDAIFYPDIIIAGQRLGGMSTNNANYLRTLKETLRAQRMHGQILPSKFWLKEMAKELIRLSLWNVFGEQLARRLLDLRRRMKDLPPHWTKT